MITDQITVIVPSWNYGMFLRECLDSILAQTIKPKKIIVANDASTDNTAEIATEYMHRIGNGEFGDEILFQLITNDTRLGTIANENKAAESVETPWMFFLDADDKIDSTYIEKILEKIRQHDDGRLAIVYSDMLKFGNWSGVWVTSDWDDGALRRGNYINGHSAVRVDLFRQVGGLKDTHGFEDHQLWVDILDLNGGYYGRRIPEPLVWYRRHDFGHRTDRTDVEKREGIK